MPAGVTFDVENSRLIVADSQRSRVQIYNKVKNYMEPQFQSITVRNLTLIAIFILWQET